MTSAVPVPPGADADARFAAYLADIAAHTDDPEWGEDYRALLDDDPQTQRALFDLGEAMAAGSATALPMLTFVTAAAAAVIVITVGLFMLGWAT